MTTLKPGALTLDNVRDAYQAPCSMTLPQSVQAHIEAAADFVLATAIADKSTYGINTGFGKLAQTRIAPEQTQALQHALLKSHSTGVGPAMPLALVRLALLLKINALAQGYSGVRPLLLDNLMRLLNANALPWVPSQGSVGASGDLAPLAHLSGVLIGLGKIHYKDTYQDSVSVLKTLGIEPMTLAPKEGLALINGTQISLAFALGAFFTAQDCWRDAVVIGAMSVEGACASRQPFDARIHTLRRHSGQITAAACFRHLLQDSSGISQSHADCDKVQDPYSLRCQPQVMGACLQHLWHARDILSAEVNAVTDNPLVFVDSQEVLTGGNFHAQAIAMACDSLALVLAEIGSLAERRIAFFMEPQLSGLPAFLTADSGVNSGFMIAQVTAAALVSENKLLSHPASVDSIPTSANQEDHVSMATHGARRLLTMVENLRAILAIEWLVAGQALELRRPLHASDLIEQALSILREEVTPLIADRVLAEDIEQAKQLLLKETLADVLPPCFFEK